MKFLVTDIDENQQIQTKGIIQLCNNTINLYLNSVLYYIPCVVNSNINLSLDETKFVAIPNSTIIVYVANNTINQNITRNQIYNLSGDNYKIIDINRVVKPGLLVLKMEYAVEEVEEHLFEITILNGENIKISQSETLIIDVELKDNGVIVTSPALLYSSSDESIVTIDDSGLITGISIGNAIITCKLQNNETVCDTINVTVEEIPIEDSFSINISGETTVKLGNDITLTANVLNNGIVDIAKSVIWFVTNQDGSNNQYVSIVSQDGNSITLQATDNSSYVNKYVLIRSIKNDDNDVYSEHLVQIKSLF